MKSVFTKIKQKVLNVFLHRCKILTFLLDEQKWIFLQEIVFFSIFLLLFFPLVFQDSTENNLNYMLKNIYIRINNVVICKFLFFFCKFNDFR